MNARNLFPSSPGVDLGRLGRSYNSVEVVPVDDELVTVRMAGGPGEGSGPTGYKIPEQGEVFAALPVPQSRLYLRYVRGVVLGDMEFAPTEIPVPIREFLGNDAADRPLFELLRSAAKLLSGPISDCLHRKADEAEAALAALELGGAA